MIDQGMASNTVRHDSLMVSAGGPHSGNNFVPNEVTWYILIKHCLEEIGKRSKKFILFSVSLGRWNMLSICLFPWRFETQRISWESCGSPKPEACCLLFPAEYLTKCSKLFIVWMCDFCDLWKQLFCFVYASSLLFQLSLTQIFSLLLSLSAWIFVSTGIVLVGRGLGLAVPRGPYNRPLIALMAGSIWYYGKVCFAFYRGIF